MEQNVHSESLQYGKRVALLAIIIILALTGLKVAAGYITNTVVLYADAVNSLSDAVTMFAIFFGLFMAKREADQRFHYGYAKIETFVAFVVASFVLYLGVEVFAESVDRLFVMETIDMPFVAVGMVAISTVVSFLLSVWLTSAGKKINALSLVASGEEKRVDVWAQGVVLLGISASHFAIPYLEGAAGILLALLIFKTAIGTLREALLYLLDYWGDPKVVQQIQKIIMEHSRIVTAVRRLRLRHSGPYIFGEAFLEINPFIDIRDFRNDLYMLEERIKQEVKYLKDFVLYVIPKRPSRIRVAVPIREENGLQSLVAEYTEETTQYLFVDICDRRIVQHSVQTFKSRHDGAPEKIYPDLAAFLKEHHVNIFIATHVHSLLFYHLRLENIQIYPFFHNVRDVLGTIQLLLIDV